MMERDPELRNSDPTEVRPKAGPSLSTLFPAIKYLATTDANFAESFTTKELTAAKDGGDAARGCAPEWRARTAQGKCGSGPR